jgi:hypothetical protein
LSIEAVEQLIGQQMLREKFQGQGWWYPDKRMQRSHALESRRDANT